MRVVHLDKAFLLWVITAAYCVPAQNQVADTTLSVNVRSAGSSGIVWLEAPRPMPPGVQIEFSTPELRIEGQYVPSLRHNGWLTAKLPVELVARSRASLVSLKIKIGEGADSAPRSRDRIEIHTPAYTLTQRTDIQAGFPSRICFPSGQVLDTLTWGDRLFGRSAVLTNDGRTESWEVATDPKAALALVSDGPVCTVVRQTVHFVKGNGIAPPGHPAGIYQWVFFKTKEGPVYLEAEFSQHASFQWDQLHFGEMHIDNAALPEWYGSNNPSAPASHGTVSDKQTIINFKGWAALADGKNFIAFHDSSVRLYADKEKKRIYLHAASDLGWKEWHRTSTTRTAWLQIARAAKSVQESADAFREILYTPALRCQNTDPDWHNAIANANRYYGRNGPERETLKRHSADLAVALARFPNATGQSLSIDAVAAVKDGVLLAEKSQEAFNIEIEDRQKQIRYSLSSLSPWKSIQVGPSDFLFQNPVEVPGTENLSVRIVLEAKGDAPGIRWRLKVHPGSDRWRVHTASVGNLALESIGTRSHALFPGGEGTVVHNPISSKARHSACYPSLGAVMAWMALWDDDRNGGIYLGAHDPSGAVKQLTLDSADSNALLHMKVEHRLPFTPDTPDADIAIPGEIVWQTFNGDWYEAAKLYRDWVRRNASWYPPMGPEGRRTSPLWLKQLCVWSRVFGDAKTVVPQAERFHQVMGIPCGFHWYVWHHNPFDNDYPHYFPAKPGFAEGVKAIQSLGCYVMPYTNGRLWDTHDREAEDWQFSAVGSTGVCRRADGKMVTESYRSKEVDGTKVVFGVMCPGSQVWKDKVSENDCRLVNEVGLNGVYMDQIAAASPVSCEATSHGHPLGGGSWWVAEYRKMLQDIRGKFPAGRIMASECNAETYVGLLDAMVCWHIEGQDVVPAYSLIYSGVVFRYGRAYDNNRRAMRMKWANNLVNGDVPGWFPPEFADIPELKEYLLPLVHFRHHAVQYFYLGELSRPPKLRGEVPVWSEDWNIFGRHAINAMPVVQTALRRILDYEYADDGTRIWNSGKVRSALLILTNFADQDAHASLDIDWQELGIDPSTATARLLTSAGETTPFEISRLKGELLFPASQTWGIEILPATAEGNK